MDPSALIFVALAVAWAVYLIPKALQQHDEAVRSRSVERFSASMRVLARREPVGRKDARLVVTPGRKISLPTIHTKASVKGARPTEAGVPDATAMPTEAVTPAADPTSTPTVAPRPSAAATAARRRRRVLGLVLLALAAVATVAAFGVISWAWTAIPGGLLVAWLVACRLMVRSERRLRPARRTESVAPAHATAPVAPTAGPVADEYAAAEETGSGPLGPVAEAPQQLLDPDAWDMVPPTLPTYVSAPAAARRTVQTIDLDSTGVWSSGRNADDSALARGAEEAQRAAREAADRRATGS